jgi:hypothetical protein
LAALNHFTVPFSFILCPLSSSASGASFSAQKQQKGCGLTRQPPQSFLNSRKQESNATRL